MPSHHVRKERAPLRGGLEPHEWKRLTPLEKLQTLYGMALDSAFKALAWPEGDLAQNPHMLASHTSARHDVLMLATKWGIEHYRDHARTQALDALKNALAAAPQAKLSQKSEPGEM